MFRPTYLVDDTAAWYASEMAYTANRIHSSPTKDDLTKHVICQQLVYDHGLQESCRLGRGVECMVVFFPKADLSIIAYVLGSNNNE